MKKLLLSLLVAVTGSGVLAQGKISFGNDSLHLYYMGDAADMLPADAPLAGQPVPLNGVLLSGVTLLVDLYGGTTSSSLALITTATFSGSTAGRQNNTGVILANIPGGAPAFFQVRIRDSADLPGTINSLYWGSSEIFTVVPSSSIAYNSIVNHVASAQSTWADGTYDLGAAGFGAIKIPPYYIPEPTALSLMGLGCAVLLASRRRG